MKEKIEYTASKWLVLILIVGVVGLFLWSINLIAKAIGLMSSESWVYASVSFGVILVAFMIIAGAINMCSVKLTESAIYQIKFFESGKFMVKKFIKWTEVVRCERRPEEYRISSSLVSVEINVTVFSNPKNVVKFIEKNLS